MSIARNLDVCRKKCPTCGDVEFLKFGEGEKTTCCGGKGGCCKK